MSKRLLQITVFLLSLLPLSFGLLGMAVGISRFNPEGQIANVNLDSQFRFLSGWYLGLAILAWWIALRIEQHTTLFRIICIAVFLGGCGRLMSIATVGVPDQKFLMVLGVELLFPLLIVWQSNVSKRSEGRASR
jgi:hypothetical protein